VRPLVVVHTGLSKLPFCKVKLKQFSECVTDHLTQCLYNFAHFLVAIVKSLTTIALVWYRAAHAQLLVPVLNVPEYRAVTHSRWQSCGRKSLHVAQRDQKLLTDYVSRIREYDDWKLDPVLFSFVCCMGFSLSRMLCFRA